MYMICFITTRYADDQSPCISHHAVGQHAGFMEVQGLHWNGIDTLMSEYKYTS